MEQTIVYTAEGLSRKELLQWWLYHIYNDEPFLLTMEQVNIIIEECKLNEVLSDILKHWNEN